MIFDDFPKCIFKASISLPTYFAINLNSKDFRLKK